KPDPEALALMTPQSIERLAIIPFVKESKRLQVLIVDPSDLAALDELAFITGLKPSPIVIPELRFWQLLRELFAIDRHLRGISVPPPPDYLSASYVEPKTERTKKLSEDLISEDRFDQLYQRRDGFPQLDPASSETVKESLDPHESTEQQEEDLPLLSMDDLEEWNEALPTEDHASVEAPTEKPAPVPQRIERRVWTPSEGNLSRRVEDRLLSEEAGAPPSQPPAPIEDGALDFKEAQALIAGANDRHAIARGVLRYARSTFSRCMIFTVHRAKPGDPASGAFAPQRAVALGWDALGGEIDRWSFRSLMVPLDGPSVFKTVVDNRAHYLGGLQKTKINIEFLRVMGKRVPLSAFVMPVLARGRVVNVFYADNGHRQHCSTQIAELLILAQKISQSYEGLFQQRRETYHNRDQEI
ncbi:MAG: hypothetical protein JRF33_25015, partial [Deltaproteobacteria bacterium]|nr:hypothetical protein [Deltaproteobacteria bacterium]